MYRAVLREVYTRCRRGWHLRRHWDHTLTWTTLRRPLAPHRPELHHSDQGVPYAATAYSWTWRGVGSHISLAAVGEATEHGYAERLIRTITEEVSTLHDYPDFHDAYQTIAGLLDDVYQHTRRLSALGYVTPAAFEPPWRQQQRARRPVKGEMPETGPTLGGHYNWLFRHSR